MSEYKGSNKDVEMWLKKIIALLHDPIFKPVALYAKNGHEYYAAQIIEKLNINLMFRGKKLADAIRDLPKEVKVADSNSSASDRLLPPISSTCKGRTIYSINPFSGSKRSLNMRIGDTNLSKNLVELISKKLKERKISNFISDPRKLFLFLWRYLPDALRDSLDELCGRGEVWGLLPADTRIPIHSVWHHVKATSALVSCVDKNGRLRASFISVDFGGVQDLVTVARKASDWWAGSLIASYLAWESMKPIVEELGPDAIVYPELWGIPIVDLWLLKELGNELEDEKVEELARKALTPMIPNSFIAIVPTDLANQLEEKVRKAAKSAWRKLCKAAMDELLRGVGEAYEKNKDSQLIDETWDRHTEELPLLLRVRSEEWPINAETWLEEHKGEIPANLYSTLKTLVKERGELIRRGELTSLIYGALHSYMGRLIGAYKFLRFQEIRSEPPIEGGGRCSLCGIRNIISLDKGFWVKLEQKGIVDEGERLCTICMVKRFFKNVIPRLLPVGQELNVTYPSTGDVATSGFKESVLRLICFTIKKHRSMAIELLKRIKRFCETYRDFAIRLHIGLGRLEGHIDEKSGIPKLDALKCKLLSQISQDKELREFEDSIKCFVGIEGEYLLDESYDRELGRVKRVIRTKRGELTKEMLSGLEQAASSTKEELRKLIEAVSRVIRELKDRGMLHELLSTNRPIICEPNDNFVIIALDGDSMGKWLSGEHEFSPTFSESVHGEAEEFVKVQEVDGRKLGELKRPQAPSVHSIFSHAISRYAMYVIGELESEKAEFLGRTIYAGGDDCVILVTPEDAVLLMLKLRERFSKEWTDGCFGLGHRITLSAGMTSSHYMHHLADSIRRTHQLLEDAKGLRDEEKGERKDEKDAYAISLLSRSGLLSKAKPAHWFYPGPKHGPDYIKRLTWLNFSYTDLLTKEEYAHSPLLDALRISLAVRGVNGLEVSRRLIHEFSSIAGTLEDLSPDAAATEAVRLALRHSRSKEFIRWFEEACRRWAEEGALRAFAEAARLIDSMMVREVIA